jgi:glucose-6-phosphate 1-epimerase
MDFAAGESHRLRLAEGAEEMTAIAELRERFQIPGVLEFEQGEGGMTRLVATTPDGDATVYLQGAHLTHWKPADEQPAIFVSERAEYATGKAIRGGVPVVFPWFGERHDGKTGPQHGFARISEWELAFAGMAAGELHLAFTLGAGELSRSLGYDDFRLAYRMTIGRELTLELTVANDSKSPLLCEEALHTYFAVGDARRVEIDGLGGTVYLDKVDAMRRKTQPEGALRLVERTDRTYLNTDSTCVLHDAAWARRIVVAKSGSLSTVVWNPWSELTAKMADMEQDGWLRMACIETANVGEDAVAIAPGESHSLRAHISIEKDA